MSIFKQFKMDEKKELEGIEIPYGPNDDGTIPTFRILHQTSSNQKYARTLRRETLPHKRLIEMNALPQDKARLIGLRVFCLSILVGWDNVQDENDKLIPFSFDNAMELLQTLPSLYDRLNEESAKDSLFLQYSLENEAKN